MISWFDLGKVSIKWDTDMPVSVYDKLKSDFYPSCNCQQCVEARNKKTVEENVILNNDNRALRDALRKSEQELRATKDTLVIRTNQYNDASDRAAKYAKRLDENNNVLRDMLPILKIWLNTWTNYFGASLSLESKYIIRQFIANIEKVLQQ